MKSFLFFCESVLPLTLGKHTELLRDGEKVEHYVAYCPDAKAGTIDYYGDAPPGLEARNIVGHAQFFKFPDDQHYTPLNIIVNDKFRRKGVASFLYKAAAHDLGPINNSQSQTEKGKDFRIGLKKKLGI